MLSHMSHTTKQRPTTSVKCTCPHPENSWASETSAGPSSLKETFSGESQYITALLIFDISQYNIR